MVDMMRASLTPEDAIAYALIKISKSSDSFERGTQDESRMEALNSDFFRKLVDSYSSIPERTKSSSFSEHPVSSSRNHRKTNNSNYNKYHNPSKNSIHDKHNNSAERKRSNSHFDDNNSGKQLKR
jgi:hypothetical protein